MKLSFKHILLAFLPAVVISCGDSGKITVDPSSFVVEKTLYKLEAAGGDLNISYSIRGAAEGQVAEVFPADSWIEVIDVDASTITLNIAANDTRADRTGRLVLSGDNVKDLTLHISQSKVSDSTPIYGSYSIDVTNITTSYLDVEVTPVNPNAYYYTNLLTDASYSTMTESQLVAAYAKNMLDMADIYGGDPHGFLYRGYFNTAEAGNVSLDLRDDTDYRVFAFDLDFDENNTPIYSGKVESVKVRTKRASQVSMTFEIEFKENATVTVTPSNSSYSYVCGIAPKAEWDEYAEKKDAARDFIDIAKQYGMLENALYYGQRDVDFMYLLDGHGTYVVYAVGYRNSTTDRGLTTGICFEEFEF